MTRIVITSPSYSPSIGGVVVLHKLCDILLTLGYDAYLYPFGRFAEGPYYMVNPDYKSQILSEIDPENDIVIYPEIRQSLLWLDRFLKIFSPYLIRYQFALYQ